MPVVRTGYSCPTCKRSSGETNEVVADNAKLKCSKYPEHSWADQTDFLEAGPRIEFQTEQPRPAPQANHTSLNVSVPVHTANALLSKYGEKRDATIAALLNMLAEGEPLILSDTDLQRMSQQLPERPRNGSHLIGMIFSLTQQIAEQRQIAEQAAADIQAYRGMAPGRVVVDLGDQFTHASARAKDDGVPTEVWVSRNLKTALENSWF